MNCFYLDYSTMWKGVGPAGKLVRTFWLYALARLEGNKVSLSDDTKKCLEKCFDFPVGRVSPKNKKVFVITNPLSELQKVASSEKIKELVQESFLNEHPISLEAKEALSKHQSKTEGEYLCVYLRGTDKINETFYLPPILHSKILLEVRKQFPSLKTVICSDSAFFIKMFSEMHPVIETETHKSSTELPLHLHSGTKLEEQMRDAFVDALIMSQSKHLIYTPSMMVQLATFLNPSLQKTPAHSILNKKEKEILVEATKYIKSLYLNWCSVARRVDRDFK